MTAGAASLLIASAPMVTALLARLLLKEALGRWAWAGIVLRFGGLTTVDVSCIVQA